MVNYTFDINTCPEELSTGALCELKWLRRTAESDKWRQNILQDLDFARGAVHKIRRWMPLARIRRMPKIQTASQRKKKEKRGPELETSVKYQIIWFIAYLYKTFLVFWAHKWIQRGLHSFAINSLSFIHNLYLGKVVYNAVQQNSLIRSWHNSRLRKPTSPPFSNQLPSLGMKSRHMILPRSKCLCPFPYSNLCLNFTKILIRLSQWKPLQLRTY